MIEFTFCTKVQKYKNNLKNKKSYTLFLLIYIKNVTYT